MTVAQDEIIVRRYLRAVVGHPVQAGDEPDVTMAGFIRSGRRWAKRAGVDRETLERLGVPAPALDGAGISHGASHEVVKP